MKTSIAVLASGRGTNFEAILRAVKAGQLDADVRVLLTDSPQAKAIQIAEWAGIPAEIVELAPKDREREMPVEERRRQHDEAVLRALSRHMPKFLVLAGYMRVVSSRLIDAFRSDRGYSRIVNVHPSLLPAFPGLKSYGQAFHHGVKVAGVTIHLVEEQVDNGPICAQTAFDISGCRTEAEVEQLGLGIEHQLYPKTLSWVLPEAFDVEVRAATAAQARRLYVRPR